MSYKLLNLEKTPSNVYLNECIKNHIYGYIQWRIQDFPGEGVPTPHRVLNFYFACIIIGENRIEMEIWTGGGGTYHSRQ